MVRTWPGWMVEDASRFQARPCRTLTAYSRAMRINVSPRLTRCRMSPSRPPLRVPSGPLAPEGCWASPTSTRAPGRRVASAARLFHRHRSSDDTPNFRAIDVRVSPSWTLYSRRRSEEHTSELQSRSDLVCRLLLEKKNTCTIRVHNLISRHY